MGGAVEEEGRHSVVEFHRGGSGVRGGAARRDAERLERVVRIHAVSLTVDSPQMEGELVLPAREKLRNPEAHACG